VLIEESVVFSYWTKMLDLVQKALSEFSFGICRIDGSTSLEERSLALDRFNEDPQCSVMLATIGSAGEGYETPLIVFSRLDLAVANHVHLMEPHWNPMAEAQAVDRVYRIGQRREVTVTRYIVPNSIETVRVKHYSSIHVSKRRATVHPMGPTTENEAR
jgi:SNF2 family DNA or RNA helicase